MPKRVAVVDESATNPAHCLQPGLLVVTPGGYWTIVPGLVVPAVHALTHAAAGVDPLTLTEAQITGLVADLAALTAADGLRVLKAGDAMTGDLSITDADFATLLQLKCPGNAVGFRFHTVSNGGWPEPAIEVGAVRFTSSAATAQFRLLPSGTAIYFQNTVNGGIWFGGLNGAFASLAQFHATLSQFDGIVVLPKTTRYGIKVDTTTPTFPWADLKGKVNDRTGGGALAPAWSVWKGNIRQYAFSNAATNELTFEFHIPHDYVAGTDIYLHAHWSQATVDTGGPAGVPGTVVWQYEATYAKGHDQAAFAANVNGTLTQQASGTAYRHMLPEVQFSQAGGSASRLVTADLEPDGLVILRFFRDPTDASDTLGQTPFLHEVDIHYQTTGIATKAKSPPFYV